MNRGDRFDEVIGEHPRPSNRHRALRFGLATLSVLVAALFGFITLAARLDFSGRGCENVPVEEWATTGNCADAHSTMWFAGCLAGAGLLSLLFISRWRR